MPGKHWTDAVRRNRKFELLLRSKLPLVVTNREAYQIYQEHCHRGSSLDDFMKMNVRNLLSAMLHDGILKRILPGVYFWVTTEAVTVKFYGGEMDGTIIETGGQGVYD